MRSRAPTDTHRVTHSRANGRRASSDRAAGDLADPMRLLANGIPLTLLLDLVSPHGPDSVRIAESEAASWA